MWLSRPSARSVKYEANTSHSTRKVVSRASQVHQVPQAVRAQIEPVISTRLPNNIPTLDRGVRRVVVG